MRKLTGGLDRVTVSGKNLREAIADLDRQFPGIAGQLLDNGDIKASIAVSIDGEVGTNGVLETIEREQRDSFHAADRGRALKDRSASDLRRA